MYRLTVTGLDKLTGNLNKLSQVTKLTMKNAMDQSLTAVTNIAKENAPVKTGRLRRSIFSRTRSLLEGQVSTGTEYAKYVEFGTKAHQIVPRRAKVLAFKVGGKLVFARKVSHPGFSGRFYMRRTAQQGMFVVKRIYEQSFNRLFSVLFK